MYFESRRISTTVIQGLREREKPDFYLTFVLRTSEMKHLVTITLIKSLYFVFLFIEYVKKNGRNIKYLRIIHKHYIYY